MYAIRSYYAYSRVVVCILVVWYYAYGIGIGIRARTVWYIVWGGGREDQYEKFASYVTTLVLLVVVYAYYIIIIGGQSGDQMGTLGG